MAESGIDYKCAVRDMLITNAQTLMMGIPLVVDCKTLVERALILSEMDFYPDYEVTPAREVRLGYKVALVIKDKRYGSRNH